jgi:glucose/mannose-6-phosphate isomerase
MSLLNDPEVIAAGDPGGMRAHLEGFSSQLRKAAGIGESCAISRSGSGISSVAVLGMGGSAIGGEFAQGYLYDRLRVPIQVVRNYCLPAYVGPDTLVITSSYSGNTEETLASYSEAVSRGAKPICFTTGGELARRANEAGHDVVTIPPGLPPRAALGYSLVPLLRILGRLGLAPDPISEIDEGIEMAAKLADEYGMAGDLDSNPAKDLAEWLHGYVPVIYGSVPWTSVIATRWCGQFSENSKVVAHANELPEMNHNEIVGWGAHSPLTEMARVVFLCDSEDHTRVARRIEITRESIASTGAEVRSFGSRGASRLARLLSLVILGDFASLYLAVLSGADPTPVRPIDKLKAALAES